MPTQSRPNVLWISLEDTSPRFGCYGDPVARTPNLDRLAREGCRFTRAFSTAGVCAPSRAAIITGMYATAIGAHHMRTTHANRETPAMPTPYAAVPPHYVKAFPEYLRAAGYFCSNNLKTDYQFEAPFTAWDQNGREAHWRHRDGDQPFFAVFNPTITHESGMWPKPDERLETDPAAVSVPPYFPDTPVVRETIARLYDNLAAADRRVGELLEQLEADGLAENTVVFIWSDHGAGLPRGKRWPYDAGIHIPLIVRWPGHIDAGSVRDDLVSLIDLGPTMLRLAGVDVPGHMQGRPFLANDAPTREYVYAGRDRHDEAYDMVRAVRDTRYKYLRHFRPELPYLPWIPYRNRHPVMEELWRLYAEDRLEGAQRLLFAPRPVEELYDTEADPHEIRNLAGVPEHRATLVRLRSALADWRREVGDLGELDESQMVARFWPNGVQPETAAPIFVPLAPGQWGREPLASGAISCRAPALLQLHCATQGASIGYTLDDGDNPRWRLYTGPLRLPIGRTRVRAKAIRIGYKESAEGEVAITVE
ncbi:MAG TPA: sulfatase-like hydrolase/transferase [Limnochordia bacterium]|nr:sulfatase-like hydrolase/transferase [Limnochordia bacterium]